MIKTEHSIYISPSQDMQYLKDKSIDLVVTSPPYPMIEMWDSVLSLQNPSIGIALRESSTVAFELMHKELDKVWMECFRVLKDGGIMCVNIGDATRTINKEFKLYNNHARVVGACTEIGFTNLPNIIWHKQTNSPNKFMGSGMLPCGAYVTLEHEWILVFRKGGKRGYTTALDKSLRRESSFFGEERNRWFSDLWEVKGARQKIANTQSRERNASFPLEVPFRLINMYSQQGDTVLDPFYGLGTTAIAAMVAQRNSIGVEIDNGLLPSIKENIGIVNQNIMNRMIYERYCNHIDFIMERENLGKEVKYRNENLKCKVMTSQETDMNLHYVERVNMVNNNPLSYECLYFEDISIDDFGSTQRESLFYKIAK